MTKKGFKPIPFFTEREARAHAVNELPNMRLAIIYSPRETNPSGDYWIDAPDAMIRVWEKELFIGEGKDAHKNYLP